MAPFTSPSTASPSRSRRSANSASRPPSRPSLGRASATPGRTATNASTGRRTIRAPWWATRTASSSMSLLDTPEIVAQGADGKFTQPSAQNYSSFIDDLSSSGFTAAHLSLAAQKSTTPDTSWRRTWSWSSCSTGSTYSDSSHLRTQRRRETTACWIKWRR